MQEFAQNKSVETLRIHRSKQEVLPNHERNIMTVVSRRLVPFAAVVAIAVTLALWLTASAAVPSSNPAVLAPMHFKSVPTSQHFSLNGATDTNQSGATDQATYELLASGRQIGRAFFLGTGINKAGWVFGNIEFRFSGRGRIELQGTFPGSKHNDTFAIIGGTGVFVTARGWAVIHKGNITVTFR